jgi:membrane protease subunit HflC
MSTRLGAVVAAVAVIALALIFTTFYTVDQTEVGLVLQFGNPIRVVQMPGLHVKLPLAQDVALFDRRILDLEPPQEEVIAADQKRLVVDTYARWQIVNPLQFFQTVGTEQVANARLSALISASLRRIIGTVDLQAVVAEKRAEIMQEVRNEVATQAKPFGIDVVDVRIRRADLPEENSQAVYARMKSERQREAASYRADGKRQATAIRADADRQRIQILADAQKQSQILRGQGDSEAIKDYADAYNQDKNFFAFYRSLQAYKDALGSANSTFVLSPQSDFFKYLEAGPEGLSGAAKPERAR